MDLKSFLTSLTSLTTADTTRWRWDIVGLLALLGERNIKLSAHLITSSPLCYLPRLIPAPQSLLEYPRIQRLPQAANVVVFGLHSGNLQTGLNYFPSLVHAQALQANGFTTQTVDVRARKAERPVVRRRWCAPVDVIAVVSFLVTLGLMLYANYVEDGIGLLAVLVMAFSTTLICAASHWQPQSGRRSAPRIREQIPPGDVVVRTPQGSFLVVKCEDPVARRLYFNKEDREYSMPTSTSTTLGGFGGSIGILAAVILFTNASWAMQRATAIAYVGLNVLYWLVTMCPAYMTWDWGDFVVVSGRQFAFTNFTAALAHAIHEAGSAEWAYTSAAAPQNKAWRAWVDKAELEMQNESWWVDWSGKANAPVGDSHFQGALTLYLRDPPPRG